ncbi:NAD(P)-dependent oxidoreductase [Intrasporangium sp. DVR]|uniref:NAD(P)-dependent oxidoreductase n=1 Tax=Intrasporangium sp. DVR TaxID=3127867 RepID=UPI0033420E53
MRAAPAMRRLQELCRVVALDAPIDQAKDPELAEVSLLLPIRERTRLDRTVLDRLPGLELVVQTGGHAYHADVEALTRRGIPLSLMRHATAVTRAMPELTLMLAIACARRMPEVQNVLDSPTWRVPPGRTLAGRRVGILGLGRHGQQAARAFRAIGMDVVAWARESSDGRPVELDGWPIPRLSLEELLATSDVVSIHLRLSHESAGLIGASELAGMKKDAILVNTSRGAILDETALVAALSDGALGAAGLDVYAAEPLALDSPLRGLPNVVLTPHIGWQVQEVFEEFAAIGTTQIEAWLDGRLPRAQLANPGVQLPLSCRGGLEP